MPQEVRDAIHGLIDLSDQEWSVVDTEAFQRLRGVQQLAFTHLLYPGARHSRFEHCIGACYVAGQLTEQVNRHATVADQVDVASVRLAALVHDIGHGPFSHVSEDVFSHFTGHSHVHENISAAIVRHDSQLRAVLDESTRNWVADLLAEEGHGAQRTTERDIVAGPADIDKLDYLLRDSHYCGVAYGEYDLDKIVDSARVITDMTGNSYLGFHESGLYALEEMLLARYHMHRQVYGHRTRTATDLMLTRAMILGVEDGILDSAPFHPPDEPDATFVEGYLNWDDTRVVRTLLDHSSTPSGEIMTALVRRQLLKMVVRVDFQDLIYEFDQTLAGEIVSAGPQTKKDQLPDIEQSIAEAAEVDSHFVAVDWEDRPSPVAMRHEARILEKDILVVDDSGVNSPFHKLSEVFSREERTGRRAVCLYLRPPDDDLHAMDDRLPDVKAALLEGLHELGTAAAKL